MRQAPSIVIVGNKRSHFPRFFLKHVYAVIILSNPNPAFYILCHRMNNYSEYSPVIIMMPDSRSRT